MYRNLIRYIFALLHYVSIAFFDYIEVITMLEELLSKGLDS